MIQKKEDIATLFTKAKSLKYEGIIVRQEVGGYVAGDRCTSLIKVKQLPGMELIEKEFLVIDILSSKDNWGVLVCRVNDNLTFNTPAPGTMNQKTEILINKHKYIGRYITVEFPQYTDKGKPFHAVAIPDINYMSLIIYCIT
jgi:hypothetical protein